MIDAHLDAIEAALAPLPGAVHRGDLPFSGYPYVALFVDSGRRSSERLTAGRHRADFYFQTTVVGITEEQCTALRSRVVEVLADLLPQVPGRVCGRVEHVTPRPLSRDDSMPDRVVFDGIDTWSFSSTATD